MERIMLQLSAGPDWDAWWNGPSQTSMSPTLHDFRQRLTAELFGAHFKPRAI